MNHQFAFVGFALLAVLVGCEGDTPRRSPFAPSLSPSSAKAIEFAPMIKGATKGPRPAVQGNPVEGPGGGNPPVRDLADVPDPTNDVEKVVRNRKKDFGLPFAIFERKELPNLIAGPIEQHVHFVTRTQPGLDIVLLRKTISEYRANSDQKQPPRDLNQFMNTIVPANINLPELKPNEFYIYDPALAAKESSDENLEYLTQYSPNAVPANPPAANANPANGQVTINADKLETQRQLTGYHTAMFLAKEVRNVASGPVDQNLNFVFRAGEGLEIRVKLPKAMDLYKAEKGKPPQTVADFINYLNEQTIVLPTLKSNEFYIYDPALAGIDASKENLDYLKQYSP